jgi:hypothetical protein
MITYIKQIIPELSKFSKKLDDISVFQNQKWINLDTDSSLKKLYIFRPENKLIISINGDVTIGYWEYIDDCTILISLDGLNRLLRHKFINDEFLILNADNTEDYAFFIKEDESLKHINSMEMILNRINNIAPIPKIDWEYNIISEYDSYDIAWGNFKVFEIQFTYDGSIEKFYKGHLSQKYFYFDFIDGKKYMEKKHDIIELIINNKSKRISH